MMNTPSHTLVVPILSRRHRKAQALQRIQDIVPAAALVLAGMRGLALRSAGLVTIMAVVQIAVGALMLIMVMRHLRRNLAGTPPATVSHESAIDLMEVGAAGVLFLGAWQHWRVTQHVPRPEVLTALVTLAIGLNHGRLARRMSHRRAIGVSDTGLVVGGPWRWRRFEADWSTISELTISDTEARVRSTTGASWRIDLNDCENADEVRRALDEARRRRAERALEGESPGGPAPGKE